MTREPAVWPDAEIKLLRAEIERLQELVRALADTSVARGAAGIFKGLWQGSERECEELRAENDRLKADNEKLRVLVRDISATRDTVVNMKLERDTEIARLRVQRDEQDGSIKRLLDDLDAAQTTIERLKAAIAWTLEVHPGKTKEGCAVVEMTWDQFNAMRAAMS